MKFREWIPLVLQTIVLLAGGMVYATAQEHRVTIIEEELKMQYQIIQQQNETQKVLAEQLRTVTQTADRLSVLEDFFHGMTPDELYAYQQKKNRGN